MDLFKKKKFWAAVIAGVAAGAASYFDNPGLAETITALGLAVVAAIGLEDFGKAKK